MQLCRLLVLFKKVTSCIFYNNKNLQIYFIIAVVHILEYSYLNQYL